MSNQPNGYGVFPVNGGRRGMVNNSSHQVVETLADAILKAVNTNCGKIEKKLERYQSQTKQKEHQSVFGEVNVDNLIQTDGEEMVLDCGTSDDVD